MFLSSYRRTFGCCDRSLVGVSDDPFDDVSVLLELPGTFLEVLPAGAAAIQHLRGGNVVNAAANGAERVHMVVGERGELLPRLLVRERVAHDRLLGDLGQRDV